MSEQTCKGIRKYTAEYILVTLGEKFFRLPKTIESIVFDRC